MLTGYEIAVGSIAEDAANEAFPVPTDIEGTVRPQGVAADIGAYEIAGGGQLPEPPVIDFSEISFNWRTEGATTCTAAGDWDGSRPDSGAERLKIRPMASSSSSARAQAAAWSASLTVMTAEARISRYCSWDDTNGKPENHNASSSLVLTFNSTAAGSDPGRGVILG